MGVDRRRGQTEPARVPAGGQVGAPGDDLTLDDEGDRHYGGQWGAAAAAVLEAAHAAALNPSDPWAHLDVRV